MPAWKIVTATSDDFDARMVHFVKQFFWFFAMFTTVAVVLRINSIEISSPGWSRNFWGVPWFCCQVNADILSGIFLIADRPVRIGDRVKIEQTGRHLEEWGGNPPEE